MAIIHCTNAWAGKDLGYDPNTYSNSPEATEAHLHAHEESYTGCVLALGEHNYYDDSDFYALVWDEEQGKIVERQYATTRGWTYHDSAKVDATDEVIAKARAWKATIIFEDLVAKERAEKLTALREITKGVHVRSITTRGKNKGVQGTVEWIGNNAYGPGLRVGIHVEGEAKRRYLDMDRVERTDLPENLDAATALTDEELEGLRSHAEYCATRRY